MGEELSHLLLLASSLRNPPSTHTARPLKIQYFQTPKAPAFQAEKAQLQFKSSSGPRKTTATARVFSRLLPFGFTQVHLNSVLKLEIEQLGLQDNILDEVYVEDVYRCQCSDKKGILVPFRAIKPLKQYLSWKAESLLKLSLISVWLKTASFCIYSW